MQNYSTVQAELNRPRMKFYLLALSLVLASLAGVPPHEPLDAWLASHRLGSYTRSFESEGQCRCPASCVEPLPPSARMRSSLPLPLLLLCSLALTRGNQSKKQQHHHRAAHHAHHSHPGYKKGQPYVPSGMMGMRFKEERTTIAAKTNTKARAHTKGTSKTRGAVKAVASGSSTTRAKGKGLAKWDTGGMFGLNMLKQNDVDMFTGHVSQFPPLELLPQTRFMAVTNKVRRVATPPTFRAPHAAPPPLAYC